MQIAAFAMAEVTYATGDISYLVQEQAKSSTFRVKAKQENVSGVMLPAFEVDRVAGSGACLSPSLSTIPLSNILICRFQFNWTGKRWTADSQSPRSLCESNRNIGGIGIIADSIHNSGRSHPSHQPPCQRHRARYHPTSRKYHQIHYERAG